MGALHNVDSPERGVLLLDRTLRVTYANQRVCEIFGVAVNGLIGEDLPEAVKHRSLNEEEVVEEVLASPLREDAVLHRYSAPVYSSDGWIAGRVEIYSDITARRELEQEILDRNLELAELNSQLEEAQEQLIHSERLRALGEMAAGIAHDINNVLGIILGNVQLARRTLDEDSPALKSIQGIELAAKDAAETVRRLREIGKPVDTSQHTPVDLSEIARDVIDAAVPAWRESGATVAAEVSVETRLEPECVVSGNAVELREALANMILNAAQAIESKGKIEVSTSRDAEYAYLAVSDTGVGMNEETKKRLLDPFFTTRGAEGTGLGMSMVDAIAIRHAGKVLVVSEEGEGASVALRIPVLRAQGKVECLSGRDCKSGPT